MSCNILHVRSPFINSSSWLYPSWMIHCICDAWTSLIALILATFSNFQLNLISARIPTDHNDIAFGFYILLSIWTFVEYLKSKKIYWALLSGLFAGAAVLIKWLIGLLVYSSWGIISLYYIIKKKNYSIWEDIYQISLPS